MYLNLEYWALKHLLLRSFFWAQGHNAVHGPLGDMQLKEHQAWEVDQG